MESPKDILGNLKTRGDFRQLIESRPQESKPDFDSSGLMWELWDRLTEYYGAAFTSQYGEEPNATWAHELRMLTADQFRRGFELLKTRDSSFPPNPGELVNLIASDNYWEHRASRMPAPPTAIEDLTSKEKRQAEGLVELRKIMGIFQ